MNALQLLRPKSGDKVDSIRQKQKEPDYGTPLGRTPLCNYYSEGGKVLLNRH